MSAVYVDRKSLMLWAGWGVYMMTALALKDIWMLRAGWAAFAVLEGRGALKRRTVTLADGTIVGAGDTLSEISTHVALMSKAGTKWYQSWRAAVALVEIPLLCAAFFLTWAWGPDSSVQYWYLALLPAGGLACWLYWHFLHVTRTG